MQPYFFQSDTLAHHVVRKACERLIITSDAQHHNEDSFRSQLHAELLPLVKAIDTPSTTSGEGDLFLRNLRCTIEVKFYNAAKFNPLHALGAEPRTPPHENVLQDIWRLHVDVNFAVLGAQLRCDLTKEEAVKSYPFAEDCVKVPNLTNTADPKAWFEPASEKLVALSNNGAQDWFGPGIYLPACDIEAETLRVQGGQGMFLKWRRSHRLDRVSLLRIGIDRYVLHEVFGSAEVGRFLVLMTALEGDRIRIDENESKEISVRYYGGTASMLEGFTVATRCRAWISRTKSIEEVPCYDLRRCVAHPNP